MNLHDLVVVFNGKAREFLYFKLYDKQCITPVAIMTSSAKNNHEHVTSLCESHGWFGRGRSSFQLFEQVAYCICLYLFPNGKSTNCLVWCLCTFLWFFQPLVPTVSAEDGEWIVSKPFSLVCKPGGHGVIWKLAHDKGIFKWFSDHGRQGATVRQVR